MALDPKILAGSARVNAALDGEAVQLRQMAADIRSGVDPTEIAALLEAHAARIEALSDNLLTPEAPPVIPPEVPPTP